MGYGGFLKYGYRQIIHFDGIFHYTPTIWEIPHLWKPPYNHIKKLDDHLCVFFLGGESPARVIALHGRVIALQGARGGWKDFGGEGRKGGAPQTWMG